MTTTQTGSSHELPTDFWLVGLLLNQIQIVGKATTDEQICAEQFAQIVSLLQHGR
jgi:hypothetical protein